MIKVGLIYCTCHPALCSFARFLFSKTTDRVDTFNIGSFGIPVPPHCFFDEEKWLLVHTYSSVWILILLVCPKHADAHIVLCIIARHNISIVLSDFTSRWGSLKCCWLSAIIDFVRTRITIYWKCHRYCIVIIYDANLFVLKWSTHLKRCEPCMTSWISKWNLYKSIIPFGFSPVSYLRVILGLNFNGSDHSKAETECY